MPLISKKASHRTKPSQNNSPQKFTPFRLQTLHAFVMHSCVTGTGDIRLIRTFKIASIRTATLGEYHITFEYRRSQ